MADAEPQPGDNAQPPLLWLREAQIVNPGSKYAFTPFLDSPNEPLRDYLNDVGPFDKEIYALDLLQRTSTTGLNASALQVLLNALFDALPKVVQDRISLHMSTLPPDTDTGAVIGQPDWFSQSEEDFEKTVQGFEDGTIPPLNSGNKEFVLWVVNTGDSDLAIRHYVTIVLRYGPLDNITDWGVVDGLNFDGIDSQGSLKPIDRVKTRTTRLLSSHGIADATEHQIWVPPYFHGEIFASGLSAYSVVAQLLDRIGITHCAGGNFDADAFFAPTRPWFNPDALRAESLGRAAMKAMEKLNWKARLALFPVRPFADGEREGVAPRELEPRKFPLMAHPLPVPDVSGDVDSLFEEPKGQDTTSQTVNAPENEPKCQNTTSETVDVPENEEPKCQGTTSETVNVPANEEPKCQNTTSQTVNVPENEEPKCQGTTSQTENVPENEEPKCQNTTSQTVNAPENEEPEPAEPATIVTSDAKPPSSSSSSSSCSSPSGQFEEKETMLQNYLTLKYDDIERVAEEVATAEEACLEASEFSEQLLYEVLEAPINNVPSAYAVERCFWLVRRAIERTRSAERQNALLRRCYTSAIIHAEVMHQLGIEQRTAGFQEQIEGFRRTYTTADQHLNAAYAARLGRGMGQLADVDDVAGAEDGGEGGGDPVTVAGGSNNDESIAEPGPSNEQKDAGNSKKRKYDFETTSTTDGEGQRVYTMNVHRKPRRPVKRPKKS